MAPKEDGKPAGGWGSRDWTPQGERLFIGMRPQGPGERATATVAQEGGPTLEREILLAEGVADARELPRPSSARRTGWLLSLTAMLVVVALCAAWIVRERRAWDEKRVALEGQVARITAESAQKIDGLRQEGLQKDQAITDRKSENQNLAGLLQKTLGQLQTSLDDLRHERERNEKIAGDLRRALEAPPRSPIAEALSNWLPRWVRAVEEKEKAAERTQ